MENKLDWKTFLVSLVSGASTLLGVMVLGALIGTRSATPQAVALPCALASVVLASVVMGVLCARRASGSVMIHAILCGLSLTLVICLASLGNHSSGTIVGVLIPAFSLIIPPVSAYFSTPKNDSKRKLKRLGVRI